MSKHVLFLMVLALASSGELASAGDLTAKEVATARKIYVSKCAKCHRFYDPKAYTETKWQQSIDVMSRKSRLKPDQESSLKRYLDEYRAGKITSIPGIKK